MSNELVSREVRHVHCLLFDMTSEFTPVMLMVDALVLYFIYFFFFSGIIVRLGIVHSYSKMPYGNIPKFP